jgi:uncharacterized membrane protein YfcA
MNAWQLAVYGAVAFGMSILSGIAGAGGGFVTTPLAIMLGLSPAQAVSSGKFNGIALTLGSLSSLRRYKGRVSRLRVGSIMALAFIVGLIAPFAIKSLESRVYQIVLGVIILVMIPVVILKHIGLAHTEPSAQRKAFGGLLLTISLLLQGTFSGGLGSLVNIVLMGMLGMNATEAQITKRWSQLILNTTIVFGVLSAHLIIWQVSAVGAAACLVGGFIGGRIALKKGDNFVVNVLLILMAVSAIVLIGGAL